MASETPRYRFRGSIKPTAEVKRPVKAYRNDDTVSTGDGNGAKPSSATIDIFDVIDSWGGWWGVSAAEVDAALTAIGKVDTLYVRVNSPGGEATEGIAIANLLRAHAAKIHTTNYGLAASAASYISTAGDTFAMAPGSMLMIHEAWNVVRGSADDLRAEADVLDKLNEAIAGLYALKGGADTDWRALMHAETWFTPEDAVTAGLADKVGIESAPLPANVEPVQPVEPDADETPFDAAARMFDLSVFTNPPAARTSCSCGPNGAPAVAGAKHRDECTHQTPAEPPEKHPTTKEAVTMTETEIKALRERLGLAEDADAATINAKLDELEEQATAPGKPGEVTPEQAVAAVAKATGIDTEQVQAALDAAKTGKVAVSQTLLEELKANAAAGAEARKRQLDDERDDTIEAAVKAGKISRDRRDAWRNAWDKDPEGAKTDLASLEVRFPVAPANGYAGSDGSDGSGTQPFDDDEADALAQLAGVSKEALIHG